MSETGKPYDIKRRCYQFSGTLLSFIKATSYDRTNFQSLIN